MLGTGDYFTLTFSENPENDLWREILQYTYEANIKRYSKKREKEIDEDTIACIAGSLLQAYEYYKSAKENSYTNEERRHI